jgi:hypothetical protein
MVSCSSRYNPYKRPAHKLRLVVTDLCSTCQVPETLQHKSKECARSSPIWTRPNILATISRLHPSIFKEELTLRPDFQHYPPQKHRAITWFLGHTVYYILTNSNFLSLEDDDDFLRRSRWKANRTGKKSLFGNHLTIF